MDSSASKIWDSFFIWIFKIRGKDYARFKILPILLNAYQFGGAGAAALGPIFKLGQLLDEEEYQRKFS